MVRQAAFMSYVHDDDTYEKGKISEFREQLRGVVEMVTAQPFPIFQDRHDIGWGVPWRQGITTALDQVLFFVPILTPRYFASKACCEELSYFLERERVFDRRDLILPVYWLDCEELEDPNHQASNELAREMAGRQYEDWRELRFEPLDAESVRRRLFKLAQQVNQALQQRTGASAGEWRPRLGSAPPRTLVVGGDRPDGYGTISEAIAAAEPGMRILVRPGLYNERLTLDKPLQVVGDSVLERPVVQSLDRPALSSSSREGLVAHLVLRQLGTSDAPAARISAGRVTLRDCDLTTGRKGACVLIVGGDADPQLVDNRIHDGGFGVVISDGAYGRLERNEVFSNAESCVSVERRANPAVRDNRIYDGGKSGITVTYQGRGTFESNDIFSNHYAGMSVSQGGAPEVRRNRITANRGAAIWAFERGGGYFEENDLRGNEGGAWDVSEDSALLVRRNANLE